MIPLDINNYYFFFCVHIIYVYETYIYIFDPKRHRIIFSFLCCCFYSWNNGSLLKLLEFLTMPYLASNLSLLLTNRGSTIIIAFHLTLAPELYLGNSRWLLLTGPLAALLWVQFASLFATACWYFTQQYRCFTFFSVFSTPKRPPLLDPLSKSCVASSVFSTTLTCAIEASVVQLTAIPRRL